MHATDTADSHGKGLRVGLAVSRYYREIVDPMEVAAIATFEACGGEREDILVVDAPGAFELVSISAALAERPDLDAVVTLGCVIEGDTSHDQWINSAVSQGLANISVRTGKPVAFGVLTCANRGQAEARSGGAKGNKGEEAMKAAIDAVVAIRRIRDGAGAVYE